MSQTPDDSQLAVSPLALLIAATILAISAMTASVVLAVTGNAAEATVARITSPLTSLAGTLFTSMLLIRVHRTVNGQSTRREADAVATIAEKDATIAQLATKSTE